MSLCMGQSVSCKTLLLVIQYLLHYHVTSTFTIITALKSHHQHLRTAIAIIPFELVCAEPSEPSSSSVVLNYHSQTVTSCIRYDARIIMCQLCISPCIRYDARIIIVIVGTYYDITLCTRMYLQNHCPIYIGTDCTVC